MRVGGARLHLSSSIIVVSSWQPATLRARVRGRVRVKVKVRVRVRVKG